MPDEAKSGEFRGKWTRESFCDALKGKNVTVSLLAAGDGGGSGTLTGKLLGWDANAFFIDDHGRVTMVTTRSIATLAEAPGQGL